MEVVKSIFKIAAVLVIIAVLLLASAYAIFNGIIGIVEETLGNIVGFLSNPLGFINQVFQDVHNTLTTAVAPLLGRPVPNGRNRDL